MYPARTPRHTSIDKSSSTRAHCTHTTHQIIHDCTYGIVVNTLQHGGVYRSASHPAYAHLNRPSQSHMARSLWWESTGLAIQCDSSAFGCLLAAGELQVGTTSHQAASSASRALLKANFLRYGAAPPSSSQARDSARSGSSRSSMSSPMSSPCDVIWARSELVNCFGRSPRFTTRTVAACFLHRLSSAARCRGQAGGAAWSFGGHRPGMDMRSWLLATSCASVRWLRADELAGLGDWLIGGLGERTCLSNPIIDRAGGRRRALEGMFGHRQGKLKPSSGFLDCNANKISERGRAE
jgi:hypothetical protein